MATSVALPEAEHLPVTMPSLRMSFGSQRLLAVIAILAIVVGIGSVLGGVGGALYTYGQAAAQDITTPEDARIPNVPVRGPLSMWSQSDMITEHQLDSTDGLYYSQMDREVPAVDEKGNPVLDENGEQVMVPNEAHTSWIAATTLTTSLGLGILAYGLSAFAIVVGLLLSALGIVLLRLRHATVTVA